MARKPKNDDVVEDQVEDQDVENDDEEDDEEDEEDTSAVTEGSTDDALADAEGRDRTDSNELMSVVNKDRLVATNMSDEALRRSGVGPDFVDTRPARIAPQERDKKDSDRVKRFAKLAKVKEADVISFNPKTGVGVTGFGGKYQMNRRGTQLRHLAGPIPEGVSSERELTMQERLEREANRED